MSRHTPPTRQEQAQARDRMIQGLYRAGWPYLRAVDQVDQLLDRQGWPEYDTDWPNPYVPSTQQPTT